MFNNFDSIKDTILINSLSDEIILKNLKNKKFTVTKYKKDSVIHLDGEKCLKLEIILSGKVVVDSISESGNFITISEFYRNDILGGNLVFSKNPYYPMTISTRLPTTILEIEKSVLFELFSINPTFLAVYLEFISDHTFILGDKIKHYLNKTIRESILNYLYHEMKKQNTNHIKLNITKKTFAEKIGVQRTSLSRELAKMRDDGLILFNRDYITLLK